MSKKSAGDAGTYVTIQMASGRQFTGAVVNATDDGFVELADGSQINLAHAESIAFAEKPALPDDDSQPSE